MSRIVNALKALAVKVTSAESAASVTGQSVSEVLNYIATNFVTKEKGDKGDTGDTGAYITAIELELTEGVVTGGTATLSDETTVEITVTEANDGA